MFASLGHRDLPLADSSTTTHYHYYTTTLKRASAQLDGDKDTSNYNQAFAAKHLMLRRRVRAFLTILELVYHATTDKSMKDVPPMKNPLGISVHDGARKSQGATLIFGFVTHQS